MTLNPGAIGGSVMRNPMATGGSAMPSPMATGGSGMLNHGGAVGESVRPNLTMAVGDGGSAQLSPTVTESARLSLMGTESARLSPTTVRVSADTGMDTVRGHS